MNILSFLDSILPTMPASRIEGDLKQCLEEYHNHVEPAYLQYYKSFGQYSFQSPTIKVFEEKFLNSFNEKVNENFIGAMWKHAIKFIPEKIGLLMDSFGDGMVADLMRESLNARQLNQMQMAEILSFMTRYSRRLLNYIVTEEIIYIKGGETTEHSQVAAEVKWINDYYSAFLVGLNFLATKKGKVTELLDKVPDVLVNKANAKEVSAVAGDKVDPFHFGFIPVVLNPIYHIGIAISEYQAARYHEARFEQQAIATKIMFLEKQLAGKNDAKLESVIDNYDKLLQKKTYEIAKMEEKYVG